MTTSTAICICDTQSFITQICKGKERDRNAANALTVCFGETTEETWEVNSEQCGGRLLSVYSYDSCPVFWLLFRANNMSHDLLVLDCYEFIFRLPWVYCLL